MSVAGITETVQYLTFKLADEVFALDVAKVREILEFTTITKVPQTPDFMRGVINLRGSVVPVFIKQRQNGKITITDDRMTRFWISLQDGVDFVLKNFERMHGGEIFVPKIPSMRITEMAAAMAPELGTKVVGIRPGEKLHEMMISADDARTTVDLGDRYAIEPAFVEYTREALAGGRLEESFSYVSDTNPDWLDTAGFLAMLDEGPALERRRRATD